MHLHKFGTSICGVCLVFLASMSHGANWPPTLNPDPEVQPPKWDWQLAVPIKLNPDPDIMIYDIDMFENENSGAVQMLHDKGYKVICYLDVGSWEDWRDDKDEFPQSILGATYDGFPDERWLDIRDVNPAKSTTGTKLASILSARFDRAMNMGCDAVEPDNMDVYDTTAHESSGFPLTYEDQIYFNLWVAQEVHQRQMLVGLKNDINQARDPRIYNTFDFVVSEQCFQYNECDYFSEFLAANKPVFLAEYGRALTKFCPDAKAMRISAIKKRTSLNAVREDCSDYYASQPPGNQVPTADFNVLCTGLACTFTDESTDTDGTIKAWLWTFGDGTSSDLQNPSNTYLSEGDYKVTLTVLDDGDATNVTSKDISVTSDVGQPIEMVFSSVASEDGWVRESGENSSVGGRRNTGGSGAKAIRFGDDKNDKQYKSILSFDTSSLPDNVTIVSATLQLTRGGTTGANAFNTHGVANIDIKKGSLGDNVALQNNDFEADVDAEQVAVITNQGGNGTTYTVSLNAEALDHVNDAGRTQLRLYFSLDDNDDRGNDYVGFYSANNNNAARHPKLILIYK
jgi:PKD repeat protein